MISPTCGEQFYVRVVTPYSNVLAIWGFLSM